MILEPTSPAVVEPGPGYAENLRRHYRECRKRLTSVSLTPAVARRRPTSAVASVAATTPQAKPAPELPVLAAAFAPAGIVSVDLILFCVARRFDVRRADLLGRLRRRWVMRPRMIAIYLIREIKKLSLPDIGRRVGGRDHTTVLHSLNKISALIGCDPDFAAQIASLKEEIESFAQGFEVADARPMPTNATETNNGAGR